MLRDYLVARRHRILAVASEKARARLAPVPTEDELNDGLPMFLDQLVGTLGKVDHSAGIAESAASHGRHLLKQGLSVAQVVHAYGDLCQAVTEVAAEDKAQISAHDFGTFNRCLDDAIGHAVTEYARLRSRDVSHRETERLGCLAHELRNLLNSGTMAFEAIRTGRVGVSGSTGAVLARSLSGLRNLIDRSLSEVRLEAGILSPERVELAGLLEDVEVGAVMEANAKGVHLAVSPIEQGLVVDADRQMLASALVNLLQNAVRFTPEAGDVSLTAKRSADRVLIEIADTCGGFPPGQALTLFEPYRQSGADRSGVGLGLLIARRAVAACGGEVRLLDHPGTGCVFTIDLPRATPLGPELGTRQHLPV